jgi:hypothetical protein
LSFGLVWLFALCEAAWSAGLPSSPTSCPLAQPAAIQPNQLPSSPTSCSTSCPPAKTMLLGFRPKYGGPVDSSEGAGEAGGP